MARPGASGRQSRPDRLQNLLDEGLTDGQQVMMMGKDAVVIVNDQGKVITNWATNAAGVR